MQVKFELTQDDIETAIKEYVAKKTGAVVGAYEVRLHCSPAQQDGIHYSPEIFSAVVTDSDEDRY